MDTGVNRIFITIACSATVALAIGYWLKYRRESESDVEIRREIGDGIVDRVKEFLGYKRQESKDDGDDNQIWAIAHAERVDSVYRNGSVESFVGNGECVRGNGGDENGEMTCENEGARRIRDGIRVDGVGDGKSSEKAPEEEGAEKITGRDVETVTDRETVEDESEDKEGAKKARHGGNIEKACGGENIEKAGEDGNIEKAREDENVKKAGEDENVEKAHKGKTVEKARDDGHIEKAREDENIGEVRGSENIEKTRDGENIKKARGSENDEKALEDHNVEKARECGNAERIHGDKDGDIEKAREDKNNEKAREDKIIEKAHESENAVRTREDKNIEKACGDGHNEKAHEVENIGKALKDGDIEEAVDNSVAKVSDEKIIENVADADSVERVLDDFQKVLDDGIVDSLIPEKEWVKIGNLKQLFIYPLKSGRGREIKEATFTDYGLCVLRNGSFPLRDRMFLIYEEGTGEFRTGRNYPTLVLITLAAVTQSRAKLEAVGMPTLTFTVPKPGESDATPIQCSMWWGETLDCIDCGDTVARWISKFVTGTNTGLRVGCTTEKRRDITKGPWEKFTKVYTNLRNEDTGLYSDLASYMLMTEASVDELNRKLQHPVPALQFRPNIVVSGAKPFQEDSWEWIRIGRDVVIRNVKPCPRCSMIRIDPYTGIRDKKEPISTLRTFREQRNEERVKVDGKAPTMGIYCGLYKAGHVKVGDEVYIRYGTNESNPKSESDHFIRAEASMNGRALGNGVSS